MARLLITADIHGSISLWNHLIARLMPGDSFAIAGDLFDTRYGDRASSDFKPDIIRKELEGLKRKGITVHYVYGNCDEERYLEGYGFVKLFEFEGVTFFMAHGHRPLPDITNADVIIEGHSHTPRLATLFGKIFLNPGSPTLPRYSEPSVAVFENGVITVMELETGQVLADLNIKEAM